MAALALAFNQRKVLRLVEGMLVNRVGDQAEVRKVVGRCGRVHGQFLGAPAGRLGQRYHLWPVITLMARPLGTPMIDLYTA